MYLYETATIIFIVGTNFFLLAFKVEFAKSLKFLVAYGSSKFRLSLKRFGYTRLGFDDLLFNLKRKRFKCHDLVKLSG